MHKFTSNEKRLALCIANQWISRLIFTLLNVKVKYMYAPTYVYYVEYIFIYYILQIIF